MLKKASIFIILIILAGSVQASEVTISPSVAWQGKVLTIKIPSPEGMVKVSASFLGQDFECFKQEDGFRGIVGIPIDQKTGYYDLKLIVSRSDGGKQELTKKIKVWSTKFPFSKFWLKPAKKKLMVRDLINKEWARIESALRFEDPVQRWEGRFELPAEGKISQGFGHRQIINGKRAGSHRGTDIAVTSGTGIKAPNRGKVVFAEKLKAFGGTIVLDHGQGIHTLYFHLSKFMVKAGEEVEKGAVIALSGNSGISSGPHLHWGMSVHNLRVDPMQWVKHEI
jgi:hypothetical protein